ncbi:MAG: Crp/Fnr family transcriptional regulator [Clostridia bacterium]|nr:Crp/Fnr family transcriptional regulator [Clostridia bacterium]
MLSEPLIRSAVIFHGMTQAETDEALRCLCAEERKYRKGQVILQAGNTTSRMGLVLEGSVTIESNDLWGNRTILSHIGPGEFFAETYAFLRTEPMLVDVSANEESRILFLDLAVPDDSARSAWQALLIRNLLIISSRKNLHLSGRSFHTSSRSIRGRVMSYLNTLSLQKKSVSFDIPFDRQQLADYLNVERSALSKELGKMQKEGLISTRKKHFILLKQQE